MELNEHSFDKKTSRLRWLILVLICLGTLGNYYCVDNPGALHDDIRDRFKSLRTDFEFDFNLFYSLYSLPNIILPFMFGILITIYGHVKIFILLNSFLVIGQTTFTLGCYFNQIHAMFLGRIIFGFGGESLNIANKYFTILWFSKGELALPIAITLSFERMGNVANDILSPIICSKVGLVPALFVGACICLFSLICISICLYIDYKTDQHHSLIEEHHNQTVSFITAKALRGDDAQEERKDNNQKDIITMVKAFPFIYWLLVLISSIVYGSIIPFNDIAAGFYTKTVFSHKPETEAKKLAGIYMSLPFFISVIVIPFLGFMVDSIGKRAHLILLSCICGTTFFTSLLFIHPLYSLVFMGGCYSIFVSSMWPCIPLIVEKAAVGTAYGFAFSVQNLFLVISPIVVGEIFEIFKTYYWVLIYFICLMSSGILFSIVLVFEDIKLNYIIGGTTFIEEMEIKTSYLHSRARLYSSSSRYNSNEFNNTNHSGLSIGKEGLAFLENEKEETNGKHKKIS